MIGKTKEPVKVLTIHNVRGEHQSFNNQNYSWTIDIYFVEIMRNDQKWKGYFPIANIIEIEVEEAKP